MSTVDSSSEESDKDKKKKKTKKGDKKTKKKDKTKKGKAKGKKKEKKGKDKKRKAVSSESSSSSSSRGKKKAKKKNKDESAEAPNAWVAGRLREIRRTEPDLPPHEAMKKAQEEYSAIFSGGSGKGCEALDAGPGELEDASHPCVQRANQEAKEVEEAQRAAGKSEEEAKAAAAEAKTLVLQIAAHSGLYKPPEEMPLFMREQIRRQNAAVRLAAMPMPSTGNARKEALE